MLPLTLLDISELSRLISQRAQDRRLQLNLTQRGLAARAGISLGSLQRFERTGAIAFESLLKIAVALDAVEGLSELFAPPEFETLDEVLDHKPKRKRGRIS